MKFKLAKPNQTKLKKKSAVSREKNNGTSGNLLENLSAPIHLKEVSYTGMPTRTIALLTHSESSSQNIHR